MSDYQRDGPIVTRCEKLQSLLDSLPRIAKTHASICISGESGTGKEFLAKIIHSLSPQSPRELISVNCAALPELLFESELFGHTKGSFTGAHKDHKGLLECANGTTLLLDEIGDLPMSLQAKLLRVLQEKKVRPIGSNVEKFTNFRLITATHRNLRDLMTRGLFREDLFYRINVISLSIPSLRERAEDIPSLAMKFLEDLRKEFDFKIQNFSEEAMNHLQTRRWPGNIRELKNFIEKTAILHGGKKIISVTDLPLDEQIREEPFCENFKLLHKERLPTATDMSNQYLQYIVSISESYDEAARILGLNRRTIYRKMMSSRVIH